MNHHQRNDADDCQLCCWGDVPKSQLQGLGARQGWLCSHERLGVGTEKSRTQNTMWVSSLIPAASSMLLQGRKLQVLRKAVSATAGFATQGMFVCAWRARSCSLPDLAVLHSVEPGWMAVSRWREVFCRAGPLFGAYHTSERSMTRF